jgi:hypothetical protein
VRRSLLYRRFCRLPFQPLNLQPDELQAAVVARDWTYFGLVDLHMHCQMNVLARRLD